MKPARVFGLGPKFNVTEGEKTDALRPREKFRLFVADATNPLQFAIAGAVSGVSMASHENRGFGQGGEGFAKRFGAAMADEASNNFFSEFLFPSLFNQDPRYFRRVSGSKGDRIGYALSRLVVTQSASGKETFNTSRVLGILCSGALANTYYPDSQRTVGVTFRTIGYNFAATAGMNILKEFWQRKPKKQ